MGKVEAPEVIGHVPTPEDTEHEETEVRGREWVLFSLLSILLLGLLLRYPFQGHMGGTDAFYFAGLAGAWAQSPIPLWGTDFVAHFGGGMSPPVYPMLLGTLGEVTGLSPEAAMLFLSLGLYALGTVGVFFLGRKVSGEPSVALVAALFFAMAPYSIRLTQWQATGRTLFMALFPFLAAFLVLAVAGKHRRIAFLLTLLVVLLLFASHRVAIVAPLFLLALGVAVVLPRGASQKPSRRTYVMAGVYLAAFATLAMGTVFGFIPTPLGGNAYTSGALLTGSSPEIVITNFLLDYGSTLGLLVILGVVGLVVLLLKGGRTAGETFLLVAVLLTAPLLFLGQYTPMLLLPFFAIFAGIGAKRLARTRGHRSFVALLLATLIVAAPFLSFAVVQNWASQGEGPLSSQTVQTSLFVRLGSSDVFMSNDWLGSYRIWVVAGRAPLAWADPPLILAGKLTRAEFGESIVLPGGFTLLDDSALGNDPISVARRAWTRIMTGGLASPVAQHALEKYGIEVYIEDLTFVNSPQLSIFSSSVHQGAYCIYRNQQFAIWQVG